MTFENRWVHEELSNAGTQVYRKHEREYIFVYIILAAWLES